MCMRILRTRRPEKLRGYAEQHVRRMLERRGIIVWRGGMLGATRRYPTIERKYARLDKILSEHYPHLIGFVQHLARIGGIPDFITWNGRTISFVEVKLDYEPLSDAQKRCMIRLLRVGFPVTLIRIISRATKRRTSSLDLMSGAEIEHERQTRVIEFVNH